MHKCHFGNKKWTNLSFKTPEAYVIELENISLQYALVTLALVQSRLEGKGSPNSLNHFPYSTPQKVPL